MDQYLYAKLARVDNPLTANLVWIDGVAYAKLSKEVEKNVKKTRSALEKEYKEVPFTCLCRSVKYEVYG